VGLRFWIRGRYGGIFTRIASAESRRKIDKLLFAGQELGIDGLEFDEVSGAMEDGRHLEVDAVGNLYAHRLMVELPIDV
jgi:hypothetical protein